LYCCMFVYCTSFLDPALSWHLYIHEVTICHISWIK
jgi:hypothetical protein